MRDLDYDAIFADTAGNPTGSRTLTSVLEVADFVVVPTEPEGSLHPADDPYHPNSRGLSGSARFHSDAPIDGTVVTPYVESRQTAKAIDDYRAIALELMTLWVHTGSR